MANVRKGLDIRKLSDYVDPEILNDIRSIQKDISEAADYLSVGWNTAKYNNYDAAVKRYFDYIVAVEKAYDIIIIIDSEKRFNLKNLYYVYTYQVNHAKRGFNI